MPRVPKRVWRPAGKPAEPAYLEIDFGNRRVGPPCIDPRCKRDQVGCRGGFPQNIHRQSASQCHALPAATLMLDAIAERGGQCGLQICRIRTLGEAQQYLALVDARAGISRQLDALSDRCQCVV